MLILIKDNWALNLGDIAIAESMIDQMEEVFPGSSIILESSHPEYTKHFFKNKKNVEVIPRLFLVDNVKHASNVFSFKFISKNFGLILNLLGIFISSYFIINFGIKTKNQALNAYRSADLILSAGGDFLSLHYAYYLRFYEYFLIKKLNKILILYAQSIGPFHDFMIPIAQKILNSVDGIFARDSESQIKLDKYGIKKNVYRTADSVLLLPMLGSSNSDTYKSENIIPGKTVGIVIRDIKYAGIAEGEYDTYLRGMNDVIKFIHSNGKKILFIAPNEEDFVITKSFQDTYKIHGNILNTSKFLPSEVKSILSELFLLLSGRMHPVIIASSTGVPVIATGIEFKMKNYLQLIGQENFYIDMIPFDSSLCIDKIQKLLSNNKEIRASIQAHVTELKKLSKKNLEYTKEIFNK